MDEKSLIAGSIFLFFVLLFALFTRVGKGSGRMVNPEALKAGYHPVSHPPRMTEQPDSAVNHWVKIFDADERSDLNGVFDEMEKMSNEDSTNQQAVSVAQWSRYWNKVHPPNPTGNPSDETGWG